MSLNPEYIKYFKKFHTDRLASLTNDISCENCNSHNIDFIIDDNKLVYSCGGNNNCGHQFTITLPKYIDYYNELYNLNKAYIATSDPSIKKQIDKLNKLYDKVNNSDHLQKIYDTMIDIKNKHHEKKLQIMKDINSLTDRSDIKKYYRQYAELNKIERDQLLPIIKDLRKPNQYLLLIDEPKLEIHNNKCDSIITKPIDSPEDIDEESPIPISQRGLKYVDTAAIKRIQKKHQKDRDEFSKSDEEWDHEYYNQLLDKLPSPAYAPGSPGSPPLPSPNIDEESPVPISQRGLKYENTEAIKKIQEKHQKDRDKFWEDGPTYAPDSPLPSPDNSNNEPKIDPDIKPKTPPDKPPWWVGEDPRSNTNDKKYVASQEYLNKFLNIQNGKINNKYTYQQQIDILTDFYKYSDNTKSIDDIIKIIDRRRPKGTEIGTAIPTAPWFKLCETLYDKYNIDPLDLAIFELTDIDRFSKRNDKFELADKKSCENEEKEFSWKKLESFKDPKKYTRYLLSLNTNPLNKDKYGIPKYVTFNQIYFTAGDELQFERYGYLFSRLLRYPKNGKISPKNIYHNSIFARYNHLTTYKTFEYLFDKLKKGVYVVIQNGKLVKFLPFSNAHYINNWSNILTDSNPKLAKKMTSEKIWDHKNRKPKEPKEFKNVKDLSHWYANNCIFSGEKMRFKYGNLPLFFLAEGDKTLAPFKDFLQEYLRYLKKKNKNIKDLEFFFNPRDFPVLRENFKEPYDQIFKDQLIEKEYQHKIYTPILSQCTHTNYHDIPIPTEDDMKRITGNIYHEDCDNKYVQDVDFMPPSKFKKKLTKCVFRGSATGCGITPDTNMRLKAALLSYEWENSEELVNSDGENVLDVKLTGLNKKPKMYNGILSEINPKDLPKDMIIDRKKNFMNLEEQSKCKYILDIDGHVKAFRLSNELRMGSCILLVDSPYQLWFQKYLEPDKHFILIKNDLSDLKDKLLWCMDNDKKCEAIAKNALKFYNSYLSADATFSYFHKTLTNLASLRRKPIQINNKNNMDIVVAFRDSGNFYRSKQLSVFIDQMKSIFDPVTNLTITIIEQESIRDDYDKLPKIIKIENSNLAKFNLGRLKNIGYKLTKKKKKQYFVLSDIDLIPSEDLIDSYLSIPDDNQFIHLAANGTRYSSSKSKNKHFLGGCLSFTQNSFTECNGYPNNFWGWGGEDDALLYRSKQNNIDIDEPDHHIIDLEELNIQEKKQDIKQNEAMEDLKWEKVDDDKNIWKDNGLSTLDDSYDIIDTRKYKGYDNVDHYLVKLNIQELDRKEYTMKTKD